MKTANRFAPHPAGASPAIAGWVAPVVTASFLIFTAGCELCGAEPPPQETGPRPVASATIDTSIHLFL